MSSFLCFLCHSTVNADTNEEIREKYREVVGMHLCMDSHLCYICCHVLNKLWLFRAVCLKRSLEYPVLFSEKGTLNLQRNDLEIHAICSDDTCGQYHNRNLHSKLFRMSYEDVNTTQSQEDALNQYADVENRYVKFEDDRTDFDDYFHQVNEEAIPDIETPQDKREERYEYLDNATDLEEQKAELDKRRKEKKYLEAEFKCYNCALGFLFKDTYQAHMMRHEESNGEHRVACHLCGGVFQDGAGLQQHLKRFHQTKTSTRTYPCGVCGKTYANQAAVRIHMMTYPCGVCGKTYANQAAVRTHMIKHINRKFDCNECSSTFSSPYTLAQHKKKKHGGSTSEQYYCEICNIGYSSKKSLLAHKRNALNHQQTVFECPICSRICPNQRSLSSHIESVHSGSKEYVCPVCAARYSNRKSLVRHIGTHEGKGAAKTVVCHLCGASFKGNNKLNRHLREVCEKAKLEEEFASLYEQGCLNPG
ncbi:drought induced 19 protein (Di19), zinc-binding domain-containing protein [Phthorimaea operculella]|nr:drought induced 19 protein (Di19), zinc-binding domain-containing protein [Phthorimaea operculella]